MSRFQPKTFHTPEEVTAVKGNVKNITLYPNAASRVSQFVNLDLPTYPNRTDRSRSYKTNVTLEHDSTKNDFRNVDLDLDHGFVVAKSYNTEPGEETVSLLDANIGESITAEYYHRNKETDDLETERVTGFLVKHQQEGQRLILYIATPENRGRLHKLTNPDKIIYNLPEDVEQVTELRETPKTTKTKGGFTFQVSHPVPKDPLETNTQHGLFHYHVNGFDWKLYSTLIIDSGKNDLLESLAIYADITNYTGQDFESVENIKFVLSDIKTQQRAPTTITLGYNTALISNANNTSCCGGNYNMAIGAYSVIAGGKNNMVVGNYSNGFQDSATFQNRPYKQQANGNFVQEAQYQASQKHVAGVGTFSVYDVSALKNGETTSVLFLRDVNIPFTRVFKMNIGRDRELLNTRLPMEIHISKQQHRRLSTFMPATEVFVKARHPDGSLVHITDSNRSTRHEDDSLIIDAGFCDELKISNKVKVKRHEEEYEDRQIISRDNGEVTERIRLKKRPTRLDHVHTTVISNKSIRDVVVTLIVSSDQEPEIRYGCADCTRLVIFKTPPVGQKNGDGDLVTDSSSSEELDSEDEDLISDSDDDSIDLEFDLESEGDDVVKTDYELKIPVKTGETVRVSYILYTLFQYENQTKNVKEILTNYQ